MNETLHLDSRISQRFSPQKAINAYKEYLAGKENYPQFALIYLNNDSIPELVHGTNVLTFKNGSVVQLKTELIMYVSSAYYKKKGILVRSYAHGGLYPSMFEAYCKMSGSSLITKQTKTETGETNMSTGKTKWAKSYEKYTSSGAAKKTTKTKFNSALKKLVGTRKKTKIKMYENTEANRSKYLK